MKVYIAKQPIYNIDEKIIAYDLLYRKDSTNSFPQIDGDQATAELIVNTHLNIGLHRITKGKLYCIQFTEKLLEQKLPTFFNPKEMIVKISNKVVLTSELIRRMAELKDLGYEIMISNSFFDKDFSLLDELLSTIKYLAFDFSQEINNNYQYLEEKAKKRNIKLVAKKIENHESFNEARKRGYALFQGYFFAEPVMQSSFEIPMVHHVDRLLSQNEIYLMNEDELVYWIEKDLSFSIKLLRLINQKQSQKDKVCSIRNAVSLIGLEEVQKWIELLSVHYSIKAPNLLSNEMNHFILTRAKFCENMGKLIGSPYPAGFYLMGLISVIEKLNSESMEEILKEISLKDEIYEALIGVENDYKLVLDLVHAVERANWKEMRENCRKLKVSERNMFRLYAEALNWTDRLFLENEMQKDNPLLLY